MADQPEIDVNLFGDEEPVEKTAAPDTSSEETKQPEPTEPEAQPEAKEPEEPTVETEDKVAEPIVEETAEEKSAHAEKRKEQLQNEIRSLTSQRGELRQAVIDANAKIYAAATAEDLVEQGMDPAIARVEALEQSLKMDKYNNYVTDLNANLEVESKQVMHDFPMFDRDSPSYDPVIAERANSVYAEVARVQQDPATGLYTEAAVLPYKFYKALAETYTSGSQTAQVSAQRAAEKMLSNADTTTSAPAPAKKEDPLLELWKD